MNELVALARSPRAGAAAVLARGTMPAAALLMIASTLVATLAAAAFATVAPIDDVLFGGERSPLITASLDALGRDRTAIVLYLFQRAYPALIVASAFTPLFFWLLGSTAVHAAARLGGARSSFMPILVLFAYTTALTRVPVDLVALALPRSGISGLVGTLATIWLALIAYRGIESHYGLIGGRAVTTLVIALVFFYAIPFVVIVLAGVAILIAAIVLEYTP
ncbi:MAG: hypothetical protein HY071_07175 [Chloroflexi bacterium]|nr:hypothetical protein [Chloroflexota bacterium]